MSRPRAAEIPLRVNARRVTTAEREHRDHRERPAHVPASRVDDSRGPHGRAADPHRPCYFISIAAELASVHPRTLRIYEEEGLLAPKRRNNLRLYSEADIQRVRLIRFLTRRQGVNLAGVKVILQLEAAGKIRVYDLFDTEDVSNDVEHANLEGTLAE